MKTPILDEFIEELQELKDDNFFLTKDLEERLIEFKNIKAAINYTHSCTELRDKEAPNIEDWLKDNFKRLDRHSFTNTHEDTIWLRSELVEVYNQLHP